MKNAGIISLNNDTTGIGKIFNSDLVKLQMTASSQQRFDNISDRTDLAGGKVAALIELRSKILDISNAAFDISFAQAFDKKMAEISTSDVGAGEDYLKVIKTDATAISGNINVAVNSIATYAHTEINKAGGGGYAAAEDISLDGTGNLEITINKAGVTESIIEVPITPGDTLSTFSEKCNIKLAGKGVNAILGRIGSNYYLKLKSDVTGNRSIQITGAGSLATGVNSLNVTDGTDASITVDLMDLTSTTNVFEDIESGVSLEVKRANSALKSQDIVIKHNEVEIAKSIGNLVNAYNKYYNFIAIQTKYDPLTFKVAEGAYLTREPIVQYCNSLTDIMIGKVTGIDDALLNSLTSIGITVKEIAATKDEPSMKQFEISDAVKLENAIIGKLSELKPLFIDNFVSLAGVGNVGSSIKGVIIQNLPYDILGQAIKIKVDWDGAAIATSEFSLDNGVTWEYGLIDNVKKTITFPDSMLQGLKLFFYDYGIGSNTENFTVKVTQGIADKAYLKIQSLTNLLEEGLLDLKIKSSLYEHNDLVSKKSKAQENLDKKNEKFEALASTVSNLQTKASISQSILQAYLPQ